MRWPNARTLFLGTWGGASRRIMLPHASLCSSLPAVTIGASRRINGVLAPEVSDVFACKAGGSSRRTSDVEEDVDTVWPCTQITSAPPMRSVARKAVTNQLDTHTDSFGAGAESTLVADPEAISCEGCGSKESKIAPRHVGLEAQLETMQQLTVLVVLMHH